MSEDDVKRIQDAIEGMTTDQLIAWLKELLLERAGFVALKHNARMVAEHLRQHKQLSPVLSDLLRDLEGTLAALDA